MNGYDRRPRRVFLVGWYGVDNVGDDAIRLAVERAAPRHEAAVHRYAVRRPVADPRAVRLRSRGWRKYVGAIRSADVVALGGGGLLKDERNRGSQGYGVLVELLLTAFLARAFGRRVVLLAMGVGPIRTRRGRALIRAVARLAQVRQVRDEESAQALRELGVKAVEVAVDPTFTLARDNAATAARNGHALLSVRSWFTFAPDRERREGALQNAFAGAADALAHAGSEPCFASLYWPRDRDASNAVIERMGAPARLLGGPLDWDELARELGTARVLVAMRYHAVACAAMAGCPVVPVAYEPKVESLARALGVPYVPVDDPDVERRLAELTRSALDRPADHTPDPARIAALADRAAAGLARVLG